MRDTPPDTTNVCKDPNDPSVTNQDIKNFCAQTYYSNDKARHYCKKYGGTGERNDIEEYEFPEYQFAGDNGGCCFNSCTYAADAGTCFGADGFCFAIRGNKGQCTKTRNTGDPLLCCLRDYQCNTDNVNTCFSDDNSASTCNKDFRAADTPYCTSLLTQFCLGNLDASSGIDLDGTDFTALWVNPQNPNGTIDDPFWTVKKLPFGTKYLTSQNYVANNNSVCSTNADGTYGTTKDGGNCNLTTWAPGFVPDGPVGALPTPQPFKFNFNNLPPCQSIFWRTLFGNGPTFKNESFKPFGSQNLCPDGGDICSQTSTPPQVAACSALPFKGSATPIGKIQAKYMLDAAVKKFNYINKGANIATSIENANDFPFRKWLFSVCSNYPELCSDFITNACNNQTAEKLQFDPFGASWCGCYLPSSEYKKYTDTYGVSRECTPTCNTTNVIPYYDSNTGDKKFCTQSVCIIDDVTINLAKTKITDGGVNFNQICNSCSPSNNIGINFNSNSNTNYTELNSYTNAENAVFNENTGASTNSQQNTTLNAITNCQCIMNNVNLTTVGTVINGGVNISQSCNGNAKCYTTVVLDGNPTNQEVDCYSGSLNANNVIADAEAALIKKAQDTSNSWVIFIFILVIGLIVIIWLIINPGKVPDSDTTFSKRYNYIPPQPSLTEISNYINAANPKKAVFF